MGSAETPDTKSSSSEGGDGAPRGCTEVGDSFGQSPAEVAAGFGARDPETRAAEVPPFSDDPADGSANMDVVGAERVLDAIPGAAERAAEGARQGAAGDVISLDELASPTSPLDTIAQTLGLNDTELAELFGVSPHDLIGWRSKGVPPAFSAKFETVLSLTSLLARKLKTSRLAAIARRPAGAYGGLTMLQMIQDDNHVELLEDVRRSFNPDTA